MRRGFTYSVAAMAFALAVAFALSSAVQYRQDHAFDSEPARAMASSSLAIEREFASFLSNGGALAVRAASDYRNATNSSFVNATCVLSSLARKGNATSADCPGEAFVLLSLSNASYAADAWLRGYPPGHVAPVGSSVAVPFLQSYDYNASFAGFNATLEVNGSFPGGDAVLARTYRVSVRVPLDSASPPPYG